MYIYRQIDKYSGTRQKSQRRPRTSDGKFETDYGDSPKRLRSIRLMDAAISKLRSLDQQVLPEDIVRLSPLGRKHINMLGRYYFSLAETVERGELRPLRDSNASEDFELI